MMETVTGQLDYSVFVRCPGCDHCFDILSQDNQDSDACISRPLFTNDWDECSDSTICPECECEFEMKGVEY